MSFLESFQGLFKIFNSKYTLFALIALVAFVVVGYYCYKYYVEPKLNPTYLANREFDEQVQDGAESASHEEAELYFFHVTWCPHCKTAMPIMEDLKQTYHGKVVNNTKLFIKFVDCDEDEDLADKFDVEGYPTIKLVKGNQVIEYDAKPEKDTLKEFLTTTLN